MNYNKCCLAHGEEINTFHIEGACIHAIYTDRYQRYAKFENILRDTHREISHLILSCE